MQYFVLYYTCFSCIFILERTIIENMYFIFIKCRFNNTPILNKKNINT